MRRTRKWTVGVALGLMLLTGVIAWRSFTPGSAVRSKLAGYWMRTMVGDIKVGEPFPHLILPGLKDGQPSSVAQLRGKKLILHIFASW